MSLLRSASRTVQRVYAAPVICRAAASARPACLARASAASAAARCSAAPAAASASSLPSSLRSFSLRSGPSTPHTPAARVASFASEGYSTRESGEAGTLAWRMFLTRGGKDVSSWHDIPLLAEGSSHKQLYFNFVNEIPKGTRPKMEIATKEAGNPIKQDVKKGALRNFTYGDLPFNYGCIPQTWENPHSTHSLTKCHGDNDPIDVVELSESSLPMGSVRAVKVLGVLALLDENETDWKLLVIDAAHPLASHLNSAADLDVHFPGLVSNVREWFRSYKTTDGKAQNEFAFDGAVMDVGLATKVIWETHADWAALCKGDLPRSELWIPKDVPAAARGD